MEKKLGVIGGSGLYEMEGLTDIQSHKISTPFGETSDEYISGKLENGTTLYFLPRHGKGHRILPSEVNYRANIYGFKKLGVEWILSASAVGSMKEEIAPGHMVVPDQFIDRTYKRASTFFGNGVVAHIPFGDPVCKTLRQLVVKASNTCGAKTHDGGTYICMEGPQFSTRAESHSYRALGVSVIGMTNMPEAKLAREAEICYATIALATDYDCWHESEESVTVEAVLRTLKANVERAQHLIDGFVRNAPVERSCGLCATAARTSLMTDPARIPEATKQRLQPILRHFMPV